jgi:hypothetical protein
LQVAVDNTGRQCLRTEELYREVNERIVRLNQVFESPIGEFLCECADTTCAERLVLTLEEYESIRADPRGFLMACGHEPKGARVLERHEGWERVVERRPRPKLALVR